MSLIWHHRWGRMVPGGSTGAAAATATATAATPRATTPIAARPPLGVMMVVEVRGQHTSAATGMLCKSAASWQSR